MVLTFCSFCAASVVDAAYADKLTAAQVCGEDVFGSDEQLFAEVSSLRRTVRQQLQHPLHHLLGILPNQVLTKTHTSL